MGKYYMLCTYDDKYSDENYVYDMDRSGECWEKYHVDIIEICDRLKDIDKIVGQKMMSPHHENVLW